MIRVTLKLFSKESDVFDDAEVSLFRVTRGRRLTRAVAAMSASALSSEGC